MVHRRMRNTRKLKVRRYANFLIDINYYLADFSGEKSSDKTAETELNEILVNSMPNGCINQAYVQGFACETITSKILLTCLNA